LRATIPANGSHIPVTESHLYINPLYCRYALFSVNTVKGGQKP